MSDSDARMRRAKAQFTAAAQAVLDGHPEAERMCREALAAIAAARAADTRVGGGNPLDPHAPDRPSTHFSARAGSAIPFSPAPDPGVFTVVIPSSS